MTIAQVQVDDAYWAFSISPDPTIPRLGSATIAVPYPWVQDEAHFIKLVSANGVTFEGEIAVATVTPAPDLREPSGAMRCLASMSALSRWAWACSGTRSCGGSAAAACRPCSA